MSLTRVTFCLGLLLLLSGVAAVSQVQAGAKSSEEPQVPTVSIPKGGAGMLETDDEVIIYDQGRGKGKIISKVRSIDEKPKMHEFVIR